MIQRVMDDGTRVTVWPCWSKPNQVEVSVNYGGTDVWDRFQVVADDEQAALDAELARLA